jgi:hypothetical protein
MKYKHLLVNSGEELPLFRSTNSTNNDVLYAITPYNYRFTWNRIINICFLSTGHIVYKQTYIEGNVIYGPKFLCIETSNGIEILFVQTNKNIYISRNFKSYPVLWKAIGKHINKYLEGDMDVILSSNCGKNIFLQFEKPKFKSIQEREEYCNQLLQEL